MKIRWMQRKPEQKTKQRGQATVELALIMPVLLLLSLGVLDFGRGLYTYNTLIGAVREGARYGSIHYDTNKPSSSDIQDRVRAAAKNIVTSSSNPNITVSQCDSTNVCGSYTNDSGKLIKVTASYQYVLLAGLLNSSSIPMSATAVMSIDGP